MAPNKDKECNYWHMKGHLIAVCHKRKQSRSKPAPRTNQVKVIETKSSEYTMFKFRPDGDPSFMIQLSLNKSILTREVDTEAKLSLIS